MAKIIEINTDFMCTHTNKEWLERSGHEYIRLPHVAAWFEYYAGLDDAGKSGINGIIINENLAALFPKPEEEHNEHDNKAIRLIEGVPNYFRAAKLAKEISMQFAADKILYPVMLLTHCSEPCEQSFKELERVTKTHLGVTLLDSGDWDYLDKLSQFAKNSMIPRQEHTPMKLHSR